MTDTKLIYRASTVQAALDDLAGYGRVRVSLARRGAVFRVTVSESGPYQVSEGIWRRVRFTSRTSQDLYAAATRLLRAFQAAAIEWKYAGESDGPARVDTN